MSLIATKGIDVSLPLPVLELERLLARQRSLLDACLALDGFTRWGMHGGDAEARAGAEAARLFPDRSATEALLGETIRRVRADDPSAFAQWIDAHQLLLREFIAANESDSSKSTACFVANEELVEWERVRAGERDMIFENVGYLHVDVDRYTAIFGTPFMPGPSSAL